jgi:hypothetical protein
VSPKIRAFLVGTLAAAWLLGPASACKKHPTAEQIAKSRAESAAYDARVREEQQALDRRLASAQAQIAEIRTALTDTLAALPKPKKKPIPCPAKVVDGISSWREVAIVGEPNALAWFAKPPVFRKDDRGKWPVPAWDKTSSGFMTEFANLSLYTLLELLDEGRPANIDDGWAQLHWRDRLKTQLDDFEQDYPAGRTPPKYVGVYFAKFDEAGTPAEPEGDEKEPTFQGGMSTGWLVMVDAATHAGLCQYELTAVQSTRIKTYDMSTALAHDLGQNLVERIDRILPKGWYPLPAR